MKKDNDPIDSAPYIAPHAPMLSVSDLSISFVQDGVTTTAVKNISFVLCRAKLTAIVGESGSGKSLTALSVLGLLPPQASVRGSILFNRSQSTIDLLQQPEKQMQSIRGNDIAMIFQEPMTSLNPVLPCGYQVMESLTQHMRLSKKAAREKALELFTQVELPNPSAMLDRYPHQISGGQKQRVMIAIAMSCNPSLLIADEPTTALDVRVQKNILQLLKKLQDQHQMAVLFITHDLGLVNTFADEVLVMQHGSIVEKGPTQEVLHHPQHPYTQALLACRPKKSSKGKRLPVVSDFLAVASHAEKTGLEEKAVVVKAQSSSSTDVLLIENLQVYFPAARSFLGKTTSYYKAVDDVSFAVRENETLGLVGESGCGKTTLGRAILQLVKPTAGRIILHGKDITSLSASALRAARKDLQIVFQDPYGSLNPRISIGEAILEPLRVHGMFSNNAERKEAVVELLRSVNLNPDLFNRYPHQFSGGQRQRICIARALALKPSFLIFDESVSALDVSVQAQVLNLINELKRDFNFTSIFISHDLSIVHYISDRILVMRSGKIVEAGTADEIMYSPKEAYTRQLIEAIPQLA